MINKKAGFRPAFTMIELIFVIVIIGILSAVAIPRLAASRDDAVLVKAKSQISAIRSGIAMQRSRRLLQGLSPSPINLDSIADNYNSANQRLFNYADGNTSNILDYPIYSRITQDGSWTKTAANTYSISINNAGVVFTYDNNSAIFDCNHAGQNCIDLTR